MNSLDLILRRIDEEGNETAKKIIENAASEAEKIESEMKTKCDDESLSSKIETDKEYTQLIENAKSSCDSLIRKEELRTKSEIISSLIKEAVEEAKKAPQNEYFSLLSSLAVKYAQNGNGVLKLCERDLKNVPENFIKDINNKLSSRGASLELCGESVDIDSGFVIAYGMIEENCTFDALLEDKIDEIKDRLYKVLNT